MRPSWIRKVLVGVALPSVLGTYSLAQSASEEGKRKVKTKVAPTYPELARRMNVTGRVKIEVIINPDGRVKSTRALGGHPLLVQACLDAVKEWKFVAAPAENTEEDEFDFIGSKLSEGSEWEAARGAASSVGVVDSGFESLNQVPVTETSKR